MSHLLARLRSAFAPPVPTPDVELLSRFLDRNDQDSFAELVRRYGLMVFGVCRRTLGDGPDAEDAYQAVFLVLAKRAATVRSIGRVGGWLHGVAALTAKKVRARRAKRWQREQAGGLLADVPTTDSPVSADLAAVIDDELAAIPEKYRTAVVLCELRQLTLDQAAAELGVPRGTVASRLARGREALGKRLLRRGLLSAVPPALPVLYPPTFDPPPTADSISREVLRTMTVSHLRWMPLAVLPLIAVAAGLFAADPPKPTATPPKAEEKEKPKRNATVERVKLVGVGGLLSQEAVRRDVGLTEAQVKKIDVEKGKLLEGIKEIGKAKRPDENSTQTLYILVEQCGDLALHYDEAVAKVLDAEQLYRLKQLSLQRDGPTALLGRFAARELALSAEQEDKIAELLKPLTKPKLFDVTVEISGKPLPKDGMLVVRQYAALVDGVKEKALGVLTGAQKKKWEAMVGGELPRDVLIFSSGDGYLMRLAISGE